MIEAKGPGVDEWLLSLLRSWGIETLTEIQSRALAAGVADAESMIVSSPTSSGKTLVGEIAVACGLRKNKRAIYLVSHKALADQKFEDFGRRLGESAQRPLGTVGLSTGDREEGDANSQLLIATYEKALGLILSSQVMPRDALIVADEMQIIGDVGRGPDIEALCAVLRQQGVGQFVALTATVENPHDLAGWMKCKVVKSRKRDVVLHQEIWHEGKRYRVTFGREDGQLVDNERPSPSQVAEVVTELLDRGRGPVLVFVESRREASNHAQAYSENRKRTADGIVLSEELDLFSEPTERSEQLRNNAERKVAFHSADLTPQERQVIERGFLDSAFEVCFATTTLAAGVNFPFKSVVFPVDFHPELTHFG